MAYTTNSNFGDDEDYEHEEDYEYNERDEDGTDSSLGYSDSSLGYADSSFMPINETVDYYSDNYYPHNITGVPTNSFEYYDLTTMAELKELSNLKQSGPAETIVLDVPRYNYNVKAQPDVSGAASDPLDSEDSIFPLTLYPQFW